MSNETSEQNSFQPLLLALVFGVGLAAGYYYHRSQPPVHQRYSGNQVLQEAFDYITREYVDTVSVSKLTGAAITAMLDSLDPHSVFIPATDLKEVTEPLEGKFSGIGIQFNMQDDTVVVIRTLLNGPSEKIGIQPGDRIIRINDTLVAGQKISTHQIMRKLKGPRGTKVKVSILRHQAEPLIDFVITRDEIPLNSIDAALMLNDETGYIKISEFSRRTYEEFEDAARRLLSLGMKKLILDLRDNGGGYMNAAVDIADAFLPEGNRIVFTQGRASPRRDLYATSRGMLEEIPLVVLIDELSASASEILAGAIQDNDRGIIVGRRSFGKGLVQQQAELSDGSAVRLTVARYFTPSGRCIQKPYTHGKSDYFDELNQRYHKGEFFHSDTNFIEDTGVYYTRKGRKVFGGGGIMPDVFVPQDTSFISPFYNRVASMGLLYKYAFDYADVNRVQLASLKTADAMEKYLRRKDVFAGFLIYCARQGIEPSPADQIRSSAMLEVQLVGNIARYILDNEGYYPIVLRVDTVIKQALEQLKKNSPWN